jgi:hypothetical protein
MPSIDDVNDLVWELRDEINTLTKRVAALEQQAKLHVARTERNDKALIAYAQGNMVGPSVAFTRAFEILDGGH